MRIVVDLPAPFGPEKAEDLAAADGEGDVVHGAEIPEALGQILDLDCPAFLHDAPVVRVCAVPPEFSFTSRSYDSALRISAINTSSSEGTIRFQEEGGSPADAISASKRLDRGQRRRQEQVESGSRWFDAGHSGMRARILPGRAAHRAYEPRNTPPRYDA